MTINLEEEINLYPYNGVFSYRKALTLYRKFHKSVIGDVTAPGASIVQGKWMNEAILHTIICECVVCDHAKRRKQVV